MKQKKLVVCVMLLEAAASSAPIRLEVDTDHPAVLYVGHGLVQRVSCLSACVKKLEQERNKNKESFILVVRDAHKPNYLIHVNDDNGTTQCRTTASRSRTWSRHRHRISSVYAAEAVVVDSGMCAGDSI